MAGEFLQLLAHLAREGKAERDADSRIIRNMVDRRMIQSYDRAKTREERASKLLQSDIVNSEFKLKTALDKIETHKLDLQEAGATVTMHDSLKDEDKTMAANDMMKMNLQTIDYESDDADFALKSEKERLAVIARDLEKANERESFFDKKAADWKTLEDSLARSGKKMYNEELNKYTNRELGGDLLLQDAEFDEYIFRHKDEYDEWVAKHNGDSELVDAKLREVFRSFSAKDMQRLKDAEAVRTSRIDSDEKEREYGTMEPTVKQVKMKIDANLSQSYRDGKAIYDVLKQPKPDETTMKDNPWLIYTTNRTGPIASPKGEVSAAAYEIYVNEVNTKMSKLKSYLEEEHGAEFKHSQDPSLMAHYYLGRVRPLEEGEVSEFVEGGKPEDWHQYTAVTDTEEQVKRSIIVTEDLDDDILDGDDKSKRLAKASIGQFLTEFINTSNNYAKIKEIEDGNHFIIPNYQSKHKAHQFSHDYVSKHPKNASNTSVENTSPDEETQKIADTQAMSSAFVKEYNLDGSVESITQKAQELGYDDVNAAIVDYNKSGRTSADRQSKNKWGKYSWTVFQQQGKTRVGKKYQKSADPSKVSKHYISAKGSDLGRAREITLGLEKLLDNKEKASKAFLHQGGDINKQKRARALWFNNNERGLKASKINNQGAELIDELESLMGAYRDDPEVHNLIGYWKDRYREHFLRAGTIRYRSDSEYMENNSDIVSF